MLKGKRETYMKIRETGKRVVIDGQVVSADAFYAFNLPSVCYTENAIFSPHAASYMGLAPARAETRNLAHYLPVPLREWFKGNIAYHDWIGFAYVEYDQLREIWPEGACPENEASGEQVAAAAAGSRPISMNR